MKRLFTLIVAMCSIIAAMAQYPMATLSRNGELTQFTGIYALDEANNASEVGDIIYLSEGTFSAASTCNRIKYGVRVVGSGYNTKILGTLEIRMEDDNMDIAMDTPWLDGINVERINCRNELYIDYNREYLEIRNCYIGEISWGGHGAKNIYINGCFIEDAGFSGLFDQGVMRNLYINNSKIGHFGPASEYAIVNNCNIKKSAHCPRILKNSIIEESEEENGKLRTWNNGTHFIYNSFFPSKEFVSSENDNDLIQEGTTITNCYYENPANGLLDENLNCTIDLAAKGYLGEDGTVVGVYGGENPFTENPSVPTIDSTKSSVEYDAASKKLNVTITVAKD